MNTEDLTHNAHIHVDWIQGQTFKAHLRSRDGYHQIAIPNNCVVAISGEAMRQRYNPVLISLGNGTFYLCQYKLEIILPMPRYAREHDCVLFKVSLRGADDV